MCRNILTFLFIACCVMASGFCDSNDTFDDPASNGTETTTEDISLRFLMRIGSRCGYSANCLHLKGTECIREKCQCVEGLIEKDGRCVVGGACDRQGKCRMLVNAVCLNSQCLCPRHYYLRGRECVKHPTLEDNCEDDIDCMSTSAVTMMCSDNKCACREGFVTFKDVICVSRSNQNLTSVYLLLVIVTLHLSLRVY